MAIPQSQVLSVEDICHQLGYNTKTKPKRQYDLTLATKEWRVSYISIDGIPGKELTEWGTEKGNADIKVMSQKFLKCYGVRHWPPGNGGLEIGKDDEKLLQLLHQLFWRQNLAAKRNQNSKERRETIKEECLSDNTDQSPHNADSRSYVRGGATRRCYPSEDRRRLSIHKGGYIEESTEDEEESDESSPTLIFKRKFLLNLGQYQNKYAPAPVADMSREAVVPTAPIDTTTQEHKSSPKAKHILTYPPQCAEERLNTDSESILHRRVMTREKDASGLARRYREDDELDRMSRRSPSRTRTETMIGVVEANDGAPSPSPQSLSGRDTFTSKPPSDSTVNDSGGGKNGDHVPPDGGLTQKTVSTRKRTLSQLSLEAPMSAKRPPPRSTVREQIWPFTPARSAESDVGVSINDAENGTDKGHADLIADGQPRRGRSGFRACQRCQQFGVKCDVDKPCRKCRFSGSDCTLPELAVTPSRPSPFTEEALRSGPGDSPKSGRLELPQGISLQPTGREQNPVPANQNISTGHQGHTNHASNVPTEDKVDQDVANPIPQTAPPTNTTPGLQHPLPNLAPKPTYYILAFDTLSYYEEPWSGSSLSAMTMDTLFAQAATHTSGSEVLGVKFTLSSPEPGFVGRKNTVNRDDAGSLEEVKARFRLGRKEGLKRGFSLFSVLLEPVLGARAVVEDFEDVDDL